MLYGWLLAHPIPAVTFGLLVGLLFIGNVARERRRDRA